VRIVPLTALAALVVPLWTPAISAQGLGSPSRLAEVELERSRSCVGVLARTEELDRQMEPIVTRGRRLQAIAQAIALEDRTVVDSLDVDDPVEARVVEWFDTDEALARRYATQQDPTVQAERTAGRETIKATVSQAMQQVQSEVDEILESNQELLAEAAPCDGAIFVRPAVLEACEEGSGTLCEQAELPPSEVTGVRFVDEPTSIWDIEELRPWTRPTPLHPGPNGLDGGRTVGYTRVGNVVATVAFTPLLAPREQTPADVLSAYEANNEALGLTFDHPKIAFTPALGIRVALPQPLDQEDGYILHFGPPDEAEVIWAGDAGTGAPLEATVPLTPGQVRRLTAGDPLTLTAVVQREPVPDAVYAISIGTVNQAQNVQALLGYMESQLGEDLARLVPPSEGQ
jgi:hypothetical protein